MMVAGPTVMKRIAALILVTSTIALSAQQIATDHKWKAQDILLSGTPGNGIWQVFRPDPTQCQGSNSSNCFFDSITETSGTTNFTPGPNFGSAIDATWHLIGTDSSGGSSFVFKFRIAPNDTTNPTGRTPALTDVVSFFSSAKDGTTNAGNPQAVVVDGAGNIIVANANPSAIFKFGPSGTAVTTAPWPIVPGKRNLDRNGVLAGIDIDSGENFLYYTDGGGTIFKVQLTGTGAGTISTVASFSHTSLYDIRYVPAGWLPTTCGVTTCPTGAALLVAALNQILLLDASTGTLITAYTVPNQSNLQVLTLDPMIKDAGGNKIALQYFWTASHSSTGFYHVPLNGSALLQSYDASSVFSTGIYSIATYPGFNGNQATPMALTGPSLFAAANSFETTCPDGTPGCDATYNFVSSDGKTTDTLLLDAYANPSFSSTFMTTPIVYAAAAQPSAVIADDFNAATFKNACLQTLSPGLCTVWAIDLPPTATVPAGSSDQSLPSNALLAAKLTASANAPQAQDGDTRIYRDQWNDVTDKIDIGGTFRSSVYALFEVPPGLLPSTTTGLNGGTGDCIYYQPVNNGYPTQNSGGTLNNPGNVTFKFTCFASGVNVASLVPRISVVETTATDAAPLPYFPYFTSLTGGTCCTQDLYRFDPTSNTWIINVSFTNLLSNSVSFIATTYDISGQVSAFDVPFTILNGSNGSK